MHVKEHDERAENKSENGYVSSAVSALFYTENGNCEARQEMALSRGDC